MALPADNVARQSTTPFLLKFYPRQGAFPSLNDFASPTTTTTASSPPPLEIHTWPTCTLRELSHHLATHRPTLLPTPSIGTRLCFRLIYANTRGVGAGATTGGPRFLSSDLGSVVLGEEAEADADAQPELKLRDGRFVIGDYVAVAILPPLSNGEVAPPLKEEEVDRERRLAGRGRGFVSDTGGSFRGRGRGAFGHQPYEGFGRGRFPNGEWRRGDTVPVGPSGESRRAGGFHGGRTRDRW